MATSRRLSRDQRTERNRAELLVAARRVFLARGYHGATLEQIAEEAGFSKGVVYSQFRNKSDLFLVLLDARIAERAEENAALARDRVSEEGAAAMFAHSVQVARSDPGWGLLVIEFRVHAARDAELNRRYAAAHARTLDRMAEIIGDMYERGGTLPPLPAHQLAEVMFALMSGVELERAAQPEALTDPEIMPVVARFLAPGGAPVPTIG
jgi:AcrR family transcriptional regulator